MKLFIDKDFFNAPKPPAVYLCNTAKKIIGELPATNRSGNFKWNSYGEISFEVPRFYIDMLTGETKVHPLYDKIEAPRNVLLKSYGYFALQDIDDTSSDNDIKNVTAFSLEYTASNKYLTNFHINTGEVDSKEVLYNEEKYGIDYNTDRDSFYTFASGAFNAFEKYYQRNYTDEDSYTYEQIQIEDENKYNELLAKSNAGYAQLADKLYVKKFKNVQFYDINNPGLSLLHLVFENIPEWKIGNVDQSLWLRERKFSEDRISVYDFLMNNVSETFGCTFVWDSLTGLVHCYEEVEDDEKINQDRKLYNKNFFQRFMIMFAGAMNNFILCFLMLLISAFIYGSISQIPVVNSVSEEYQHMRLELKLVTLLLVLMVIKFLVGVKFNCLSKLLKVKVLI